MAATPTRHTLRRTSRVGSPRARRPSTTTPATRTATVLSCATPSSKSEYAYDTWTATTRASLWRFDWDLTLLRPPGSPNITSEPDLIAASTDFDGLGWAHTPQLGSTDLDTQPLLPADAQIATKPNAKQGDAANHYFVQDPGIVSSLLVGPMTCLAGAGGCRPNLTSITEPACLTCTRDDFPTWLFRDGDVIVEMSQGLNVDETSKLDPGLVTMLTDPALTLVPVSEPASFLRARGNPLRAFALDSETLTLQGYVATSASGLFGVPNRIASGDPPPTQVLAASALQERIYGILDGAQGEELLIIPADGTAPVTVPLSGIDADAVPRSLVYRAQDAKLYLLDEEQGAWSSRLRLVRITPAAGTATVLASTPYFRHGGALYLSATQPGDLLLAESASPGSTLFMTLAPGDDRVELTGWLVRQGSLVAPPDSRGAAGTSVVMRHRPHGRIDADRNPGQQLPPARQAAPVAAVVAARTSSGARDRHGPSWWH